MTGANDLTDASARGGEAQELRVEAKETPSLPEADGREGLHSADRSALLIAGFYFLIAAVYIAVSGQLASSLSGSVETLARIEEFKGIAFVTVTALALFFWSRMVLQRAASDMKTRDRVLRLLDRRALAGTMASSIAHDSNNALAVARANAQLIQKSPSLSPEVRESARDLSEAVDRLVLMMRRLRDLGSPKRMMTAGVFDLSQEIREVVGRLRKHPELATADLSISAADPVPLNGYRVLIDEIITNLLLNAAEAAGPRPVIQVHVRAVDQCPVLVVEDNGPGISNDIRPHLFEPFFTTKSDGTGLGLPSVASCAADHGGRVDVGRSSLGGARFEVWLPGASR